jgi:hypothetical protein
LFLRLTLPLLINPLPALHIPIDSLDSRPRPNVVFGVLRNGIAGPGYFALQHGRLVRAGGASALGDELVLGGGVVHVREAFWVGAEGVGGFGCAAGEEVSADEGEVG